MECLNMDINTLIKSEIKYTNEKMCTTLSQVQQSVHNGL